VQVDFSPEPTAEERAALLRALDGLDDGRSAAASAWWETGIRGAVEDEPDLSALD
jgi:hypothetical protein